MKVFSDVDSRFVLSLDRVVDAPARFDASGESRSTPRQEFAMTTVRTLAALSVAALVTACASPAGIHASPATPDAVNAQASMPVTSMDPRMKAMKDMQQKMTQARTPAERRAMMADHMKAMQDGMTMMKEMHATMQGMKGMRHGSGMPDDMSGPHRMATDHMAMMQTMMDMMTQRMPDATTAP